MAVYDLDWKNRMVPKIRNWPVRQTRPYIRTYFEMGLISYCPECDTGLAWDCQDIMNYIVNIEKINDLEDRSYTYWFRCALLEGVGIKMGGNGLCAECYAKDQAKRWHQ